MVWVGVITWVYATCAVSVLCIGERLSRQDCSGQSNTNFFTLASGNALYLQSSN